MNTFTFDTYEKLSYTVAKQLFQKITHELLLKDHFVLGLATGSSPQQLYVELIKMLGDDGVDLSNLYTFNLDEYYPIKKNHPRSYAAEMKRTFWKPLYDANPSFNLEHAYILNGEAEDPLKECKRYEELIQKHGGIDLQLLGLGVNGHIAFNEPGSPGDSRTRMIQIDESTIEANSRFFGGNEDKVPTNALTLGIGTILEAKEIFLLVHGEAKKDVFERLTQMTDPDINIPASYLLTHPAVTAFSDLKS